MLFKHSNKPKKSETVLDIAHINMQGEDMILVPLSNSFSYKTPEEQNLVINSLQTSALEAGLKGQVIPVWLNVVNKMSFIAPEYYHPFLRSVDMNFVQLNLNKKLEYK